MLLPLLLSIVILEFSDFNVATTSLLVKVLISYSIFTFVGTFIQSTFAVASPLLPASSTNSNVNSPFSVNVYVSFPLLFVIVTFSLGFKVTVTGFTVFSVVLYSNSAVGASLSIQSTITVIFPETPNSSIYSKLNIPFLTKVYELLPLLFKTSIFEFSDVIVAVTSSFVISFLLYVTLILVGSFIQSTFAVAVPLFPALSTNSNVNSPFSVKIYVSEPLLFVIVTSSLGFKVTVTGSIVFSVLLYSNSAVGTSLSIQSTFAVAVPLFPLTSTNSNVNSPFSVNVYVSEPLLFSIVISVLGLTKVTTTSLFVIFLVLYSISAVGIDVVSLVLSSNRFIIAADAKIPYVSISSFTY